jgi:hypothetical protein
MPTDCSSSSAIALANPGTDHKSDQDADLQDF